SGARPEWMFLTNLPVLPPDLRPMVPLDGGRYATSDSNDLYRRIIARNNRLKSILKEKAPEVVVKNEKTMIQEAVDALLDNTTRKPRGSAPMQTAQHRPLRSLADILKGKQGRFRQNLLGKRVDYSGRSVIVVGPELKLNECGLPKKMALELFRPFVIRELLSREIVFNPRAANRLIEEASEEVWSILEEVVKDKFVLLNRAPTLHRLGIEAFNPVLIEGLAIRIPPLVCAPFNADFDGDQMAVHLPLSEEAQAEARDLMLSSLGILKPANSDPVMYPKLEIVLGCYWMSMIVEGTKGENQHFNNLEDALIAYEYGQIGLQAKIKVKEPKKVSHKDNVKPEYLETNIGRLIFNDVLPEDFPYVNAPLTGKYFRVLVRKLVDKYGFLKTADILNKIQKLGFEYATQSGISWGMDDIKASPLKDEIILKGRNEANLVESQFQEGLLTEDERYNRLIQIWEHVVSEMSKAIPKSFLPTDTVSICVDSGARGSIGNLTQMAGMKGYYFFF
ncbi:MAG: DNA-directed RNA polymerase subunit beta', partial [Candidatus Parcubacteria bacterium]|nr:DNA-directed RNA polymerase subunit beta' [Candidatus Parcubacteria bacterium]